MAAEIKGQDSTELAMHPPRSQQRNDISKTCLLPIIAATLLCSTVAVRAQELPPGNGREIVAAVCGGCHDVNRIRAGYSTVGWQSVMHMMHNMEAPVPKDKWPVVTEYLTKNFPEKPRPAAVLIEGPVQVSIKEWPVPTPGSRPHDPLATADGAIWYSGQTANVLGRLDPKTGQIKEYHLKSPHTGPHGLVEDKDGNIWFTGNNLALISKLDPKNGDVTEYPMPDPEARDPHTLTFDQDGIIWFTVQQANMVGRLDPKTGEIKLVKSPTPNSRPYGIKVNAKGVPVFVEFGASKVATIDRKTMEIHEFALPDAAARPRRLAVTSDSVVWYTDYARGYLGRIDLSSGGVKEWASPSGPKSAPYGMVAVNGNIWYNESGAKPNTIVRLDPQTEKFQTWPIPGGGDIVRNMSVTRDGNPVMANSLVNAVGLIDVKSPTSN
jgi:virginiamycin B lyase